MEFLVDKNIAHRGLHNSNIKIYENTIEAFKKAIDSLFPIELDVRVTKDNEIVVFHDDNLQRMIGIDEYVYNLNLNEVISYKLKNSDSRIPALKEVFDLVNDKVPILIDIKTNGNIFKTFNSLRKVILNYKGRFALQSFDPLLLILIRFKLSKMYKGQLAADFKNSNMGKIKKFILKNMLFNCLTKPYFVSYNIDDMPKKKLINLRKKGIYIFGWTIKDIEQYNKATKYCDSIIFENKEVLNYIK